MSISAQDPTIGNEDGENWTYRTINKDTEEWATYIERVEFYFEANDIADDKKKPALLSLIGPDTFKMLRSLTVPDGPNDKTYQEIKDTLAGHFCPKRSQIYYRSEFYRCSQKPGTSITSYLSDLQAIAKDCGFGDSLNDMLRDRLVCGVHDQAIRKHLLSKGDDLKLEDALKQAISMESAMRDSKDLLPSGQQPVYNVKPQRFQRQPLEGKDKPSEGKDKPTYRNCYRCGKNGHAPDKCYYKNSTCYSCNKVGHISKVCRSKLNKQRGKGQKQPTQPVHEVTPDKIPDEYELLAVNSSNSRSQPITLTVNIDGVDTVMELDTGAAVTLISEETFKSYWPHKELQESNSRLKTYSGEPIVVKGTV